MPDTSSSNTQSRPPLVSKPKWPWNQIGVLILAVGFFMMAFADLLLFAGVDLRETISGFAGLFFLVGISLLLVGLLRRKRWKAQGLPVPFWPQLRIASAAISTLAVLLMVASMMVPAIHAASEAASKAQDREGANRDGARWKTVQSSDGQFAIDVPAHWVDAPNLATRPDYIAHNDVANDLCVTLFSERKEDVAISGLDAYAQTILNTLMAAMKDSKVVERPPSTTPGLPAIETVLEGVDENARLVTFLRFVETPSHFVQIRAWSTRSGYRAHEDTLRKIGRSFRSLRGTGGG